MAGIRRFFAAAAAAGFLLAGPRPVLPDSGAAGKPPPVVASVTFQVASPYLITYGELASLITIRPGDKLTEESVKDSIRSLYAKSLFREVSAYSREAEGKVDLLFHLRPSPVISDIEVRGQKKVGMAQIASASRLRRGIPLEDRDFRDAEEAVKGALRKKGFLAASVSVSVLCSLENGAGKVRIDVVEREPAVVRSLSLPGAKFFREEKILEALGVPLGSPFDYRRWEEGIRKLRDAYKREGFLTVRIMEADVTCEQGEGLCLTARVEEGPRYEVRWEGAKGYSVEKLSAASGLYGDEETTEGGLIHDLRDRLLAFYRERQYHRAEVDVEAGEKGPGERRLAITIREGLKGYIREIRFRGNASIPDKQLRKQMVSRRKGFFSLLTGSGKLREEDWNDDLKALVGLYQKEGFVRARMVSIDNVWDRDGGIVMTITIEEGRRYRLREIQLHGNHHFLRQELLSHVGNREGKFVDYVGLERDQEAVGAYYRNAGYLDAGIETQLVFDEGKDEVLARFDIEEGPRYLMGKVVVRGNVLTDAEVVRREATVPEGMPAGEMSLLKFQQAVFGTGLYKSVRVQRVKRPAEGILDLIVEVEETLFFEVEFGGGYGTDTGIRGFIGTKHRDLNGKGRSLSARISASEKEQLYIGNLREPWIFGSRWKWEGGLTGSYQDAVQKSFSLQKASIVASITKTFFERSSLSLQYEVSRDHVFDVAPGAILSPEDQGSATIAAFRALAVFDFRDDPFNPRRGSFNSGSMELATTFFGSEVDYYKIVGQTSWYFPVYRRETFVFSARAGYVRPLRDTPEVPIQKRFFLGGRTTVRGFAEETLGPKAADGTPTGGNYMLNLNTEFRVPLQYGFTVALFVDAGSVWFRGDPVNRFDLRESAGLGLRYTTPIGPIALDYGWKIDRREGESASEWHFTIGAVF